MAACTCWGTPSSPLTWPRRSAGGPAPRSSPSTTGFEVTLDITPGVPHVFQAYYPILDEAATALDRAGQLLSAHLASAERVTGERKAERTLSSSPTGRGFKSRPPLPGSTRSKA